MKRSKGECRLAVKTDLDYAIEFAQMLEQAGYSVSSRYGQGSKALRKLKEKKDAKSRKQR